MSDPRRPAGAARAVRVPRQERSRRSYRRLLAAASELFAERGYDATPVATIAQRAGLTVGAFYRRFASKEALLGQLEDEAIGYSERLAARIVDPEGWRGRPLAAVVDALIAGWAELYVRHRSVLRPLLERSAHDLAARRRLTAHNRDTIPATARFLAGWPELGGRVDPSRVELGLVAVRGVLREALLFPESWPGATPPRRERLVADCAALLLRHLYPEPPRPANPPAESETPES